MKAHQKLVREQRAASAGDLLGNWWSEINTDIKAATVKEIDEGMAAKIILQYEWLGCMPAVSWHHYGIFFDGICGGVVCYGPEYSENLGVQMRKLGRKGADWSRYGFEGRMILLSRGACVHWAHEHAASKLIRASMKLLPTKFGVVTATVDPAAGEIGTIYQAAGFHYVGSMRESNPNVNHRAFDRDAWLIDGKICSARTLLHRIGSLRRDEIMAHFPRAQFVAQHSKGRYFAFRGTEPSKRRDLAAIAHLIKPYPKRDQQPAEERALSA